MAVSSITWAEDGEALLVVRRAADVSRAQELSTLWSVPLEGGEPREIGVLAPGGGVRELVVHPDGRRFAFRLDQGYTAEVWLLENFLSLGGASPPDDAR